MKKIEQCRACNHTDLIKILDLGFTPLANSLLSKQQLDELEFTAPLAVVLCQSCNLLQLDCTVPPEKLFRNYAYFSSFSETMLKHARDLSSNLLTARRLNEHSFVVEIASNDGYLLENYNKAGIATLGIEPAFNIAEVARSRGIETISEFFDVQLAQKLAAEKGKADVIHAHNVMAHVPDINSMLQGLHILLKDTGVAVIEVPYAVKMIDRVEFDTIYHEHIFYFTVTALNNLFKQNSLVLADIEEVEIHGGSLRLFVTKKGQSSSAVADLLAQEHVLGFDNLGGYKTFAKQVDSLKHDLISLLTNLKKSGKTIAVYGAAAKGSTLLNFCQLGQDIFDFAVDRSTAKQGLFMPGIKLPIYNPSELMKQKPDYVLLLTWNFAEEILRQQADYIRAGGQFIVPIPSPKILTPDTVPA
jgi:SAM-dependent methyltransferase